MRVSVLSGICVKSDAISQAVLSSMRKLSVALDTEPRLFTTSCSFPEVDSKIIQNTYRLAADPWFNSSDLVVAHFGIYYELFNVIPLIRPGAKVVCVFHNITPKNLMGEAAELAEISFEQLCNMEWADYVVCDSPTNLEVLREAGVQTPASVVPIEVPLPPKVLHKPIQSGGRPQLFYVGRLVEAKGILDLVEAVAYVLGGDRNIEFDLTLAGNLALSDPGVVRAAELVLETLNHAYSDRFHGRIEPSPTNARRDEIFTTADVFLLPSYHEGFGVPVIEALGFGCRVVGYDNSNLPSVIADCGVCVATGDVAALSVAIEEELKLVTSDYWIRNGGFEEFAAKAHTHAAKFTPEVVSCEFDRVIEKVLHS